MTHTMQDLLATLAVLGPEEVEAVSFLAKRILMGQVNYAKLNLANDQRNFRGEALEEWADAAIYGAYDQIRKYIKDRDAKGTPDAG